MKCPKCGSENLSFTRGYEGVDSYTVKQYQPEDDDGPATLVVGALQIDEVSNVTWERIICEATIIGDHELRWCDFSMDINDDTEKEWT